MKNIKYFLIENRIDDVKYWTTRFDWMVGYLANIDYDFREQLTVNCSEYLEYTTGMQEFIERSITLESGVVLDEYKRFITISSDIPDDSFEELKGWQCYQTLIQSTIIPIILKVERDSKLETILS